MNFSIKKISAWQTTKTDCLVIPISKYRQSPEIISAIDAQYHDLIQHTISKHKLDNLSTVTVLYPKDPILKFIILWQYGELQSANKLQQNIASLAHSLTDIPIKNTHILLTDQLIKNNKIITVIRQLTIAIKTFSYRYTTTLSNKDQPTKLKSINFLCDNSKGIASYNMAMQQSIAIAGGINTAKQLGNLPANICTPNYLAEQALELAKQYQAN